MSQINNSNQTQTTQTIILSYLSYLSLFVGTGFISGAIVHSGDITQIPKYIVIGIVGILLFLAGSFVQEFILNRENLREEGIIKFFVFSLLLSIGIGMISGGTQHFSDFPIYSSYLIPLGLIISLVAFLLKNGYILSAKTFGTIIGIFVLIALPLHFGLNTYANSLLSSQKQDCKTSLLPFFSQITVSASGGHHDTDCESKPKVTTNKNSSNLINSNSSAPKIVNSTANMDHINGMSNGITDDQSFLENMIPHHEEAVTSSTKVIATTTDTELKAFASNVIKAQTKEIAEMKTWYRTWFNKDYTPNSNYMAMMTGMNNQTGKNLDKEYTKGMIKHHIGAIDMAKKIQIITKRPEILKLSNDIITSQNTEVATLKGWLMTKYEDHNTHEDENNTQAHTH